VLWVWAGILLLDVYRHASLLVFLSPTCHPLPIMCTQIDVPWLEAIVNESMESYDPMSWCGFQHDREMRRSQFATLSQTEQCSWHYLESCRLSERHPIDPDDFTLELFIGKLGEDDIPVAGQDVVSEFTKCPVCFNDLKLTKDYVILGCQHPFCRECLKGYLTDKINDGLVQGVWVCV
jgi:hypothetical protein